MRWALLVVLVLHGMIHFMGPAKAFGWSDLEALTQPISRSMGIVWLLAGLTVWAAAAHLATAPRSWWITGLAAVLLSQVVIVSAWQDARFGTVANLIVLAGVVYAFASQGPWSFRATYERGVAEAAAQAEVVLFPGSDAAASAAPRLSEDELTHLPDPVRRHLVAAGFVGEPWVAGFRATMRGRIRGGPDEPWMPFVAEQQNTMDPPTRLFHMRARKAGLPVDVLHVFRDGRATMQAKVLSLVPVVDARGAEMDQAETVTLFNDLALMAPGGLADPAIRWEPVDDRNARGVLTVASHTVSAILTFDAEDRLVDFVSDDRFAAVDDTFVATRWSTPVKSHRRMAATEGDVEVVEAGEGRWHPAGAEPYSYIELEVVELELLTSSKSGVSAPRRR